MTTKLIEIATSAAGTYTDITDLVAKGELEINPEKIAPKRARSPMTGAAYGGLVTEKTTISARCNPLTQAQTQTLLPLIKSEYVWVNYLDPELGWRTGIKMLSGNTPSTAMAIQRTAGGEVVRWDGISFELSEV